MPELDFVFNPAEVPDRPSFEVFPPGDYTGEVTASDYKPTKAGNGKYIEFEITILDGQYAGRKYWERLNVRHENKQAMDIANSTLKEMVRAAGMGDAPLRRTEDIHGKPMKMIMRIVPKKEGGKPTGESQNAVRYKSLKDQPKTVEPEVPETENKRLYPETQYSSGPSMAKKKPWEK